jgi:hypothetical protein
MSASWFGHRETVIGGVSHKKVTSIRTPPATSLRGRYFLPVTTGDRTVASHRKAHELWDGLYCDWNQALLHFVLTYLLTYFMEQSPS